MGSNPFVTPLNAAVGGVASHVQPGNNPAPGMPMQSAGAQATGIDTPQGGTPPAVSTQQPPPQMGQPPAPQSLTPNPMQTVPQPDSAQSDEDKKQSTDIQTSLDYMKGLPGPKSMKEIPGHSQEVQDAISTISGGDLPAVDGRRPGEGLVDFIGRTAGEDAKYAWSEARSKVGDTLLEQRQAFESTYGKENVRVKGKTIQFRPDADSPFRNSDQKLFGGIRDAVLFNALGSAGFAANIATQAGVDAATGASTGGPGVIPAQGMAGLAGGAAQVLTHSATKALLNQFSSVKQDDPTYSAGWDAFKTMGASFLGGMFGGATSTAFSSTINKLTDSILPEYMVVNGHAIQTATGNASELAMKSAATRALLSDIGESISSNRLSGDKLSEATFGALGEQQKKIGNFVKTVGDEVNSYANSGDYTDRKLVDTSGAEDTLKEFLTKKGYRFDAQGRAISAGERTASASSRSVTPAQESFPYIGNSSAPETSSVTTYGKASEPSLSRDANTAISKIADIHNMFVGNSSVDATTGERLGGTSFDGVRKVISDLDPLCEWDKLAQQNAEVAEATRMYETARVAISEDRNKFINQAYGAMPDSPMAKSWKDAFSAYGAAKDSLATLHGIALDPKLVSGLVPRILETGDANKLKAIEGLKSALGPGTDAWDSVRGAIYDHIVTQPGVVSNTTGMINPESLGNYLTNPKNQDYLNEVFSEQELKSMVSLSKDATRSMMMSTPNPQVLKKVATTVAGLSNGPVGFAQKLFTILGGSKQEIDFVKENLYNFAKENIPDKVRMNLVRGESVMDEMMQNMQTVMTKNPYEAAKRKVFQRYAPIINNAMASGVEAAAGPVGNALNNGLTSAVRGASSMTRQAIAPQDQPTQ